MKIYCYNRETGVYVGESEARRDPRDLKRFLIPACSTTTPPPAVKAGQRAVFDAKAKRWVTKDIGSIIKPATTGQGGRVVVHASLDDIKTMVRKIIKEELGKIKV